MGEHSSLTVSQRNPSIRLFSEQWSKRATWLVLDCAGLHNVGGEDEIRRPSESEVRQRNISNQSQTKLICLARTLVPSTHGEVGRASFSSPIEQYSRSERAPWSEVGRLPEEFGSTGRMMRHLRLSVGTVPFATSGIKDSARLGEAGKR
jgi:hypothetical protein